MMSTISRSEEKMRLEELAHYDQEDIGGYCRYDDDSEDDLRRGLPSRRLSGGERPESPLGGSRGAVMEQEKRIRREIANSNERRRMQSINAGFQSLRTLLPHHEGEKLSKAAILQQTAEYIYQLEQEKTRLLSQNCQLKRLINQHEGEASAPKKRKTEAGVVVMTPNETSDADGVAALLTPEPLAMVTTSGGATPTIITAMDVVGDSIDQPPAAATAANGDLIDLRVQLDRERGLRMILEDQVRSLETQLYPERIREITQQVQLQYQQRDEEEMQPAVITPIRRESGSSTASESGGPAAGAGAVSQQQQETAAAVATLQVVSAAALQPVSHTETVIATVNASPPASPTPSKAASAAASKSGSSSSTPRLTILEAAIKAEPKVEVERIPSPNSPAGAAAAAGDELTSARVYLASTSRQNLETIVEAIRHLEGDALFSNEESGAAAVAAAVSGNPVVAAARAAAGGQSRQSRLTLATAAAAATASSQDAPLALTKQSSATTSSSATTPRLLKVEMNQFLQFNSSSSGTTSSASATATATPLQQQRPGVIVVKQHT